MTLEHVRSEALRLLEKFGVSRSPVPVEKIARGLGLPVFREPLGTVSALLVLPGSGAPRIVVNKAHTLARQRFSIAHEIGHSVLRHQFEPGEHVHVDHGTMIMARGPRASTGRDPKEREANAFAAALLMPPPLVTAALDAIEGQYITDLDIEQMADEFQVSAQALQFHLHNLRLVS